MHADIRPMPDARRMAPLLRSIAREVRERSADLAELEARLAALTPTKHAHQKEVRELESRIASNRLELRMVERELWRLGWKIEGLDPVRLRLDEETGRNGPVLELEQTGFRRAPPSPELS